MLISLDFLMKANMKFASKMSSSLLNKKYLLFHSIFVLLYNGKAKYNLNHEKIRNKVKSSSNKTSLLCTPKYRTPL